jgi:hypothetical protein
MRPSPLNQKLMTLKHALTITTMMTAAIMSFCVVVRASFAAIEFIVLFDCTVG